MTSTLVEARFRQRQIHAKFWNGSFNGRESSLQQLAPYIGKFKSGMVKRLLELFTKLGDVVLDPFSGSGVVPLEAALLGRKTLANDLNPYAFTLTRGKLESPVCEADAIEQAERLVRRVEKRAKEEDLSRVPEWVKAFFHHKTLQEILYACRILREEKRYFLLSCLMGILHHQRPGFLSYPASHLVPYLRTIKFPPKKYPEMYQYRDLKSRLLGKIKRAYRKHLLPSWWGSHEYAVWQVESQNLPVETASVDAIVTSPPYFHTLDYARDNRLRLWFLGCDDWKRLESSLIACPRSYLIQMSACLFEMYRVLKTGGYCILVVGDVQRNGKSTNTAEILAEVAVKETLGGFSVEMSYDDPIPQERRSRRGTRTTTFERLIIMRKEG